MILRIILSVVLVIPIFVLGMIILSNILNEIDEKRRERELALQLKREKKENMIRRERRY